MARWRRRRVPFEGGDGELLLRGGTLIPDLSPDGRHLSVILDVGTLASRLCVFDIEARRTLPSLAPIRVIPGTIQVGRSRWTPDGTAVAFVQAREDGHTVLLRRTIAAWRGGGVASDTLFAGATDTIESFGFSPDGRKATVSVVDWLSGLTIAEGVKGIVPPRGDRGAARR